VSGEATRAPATDVQASASAEPTTPAAAPATATTPDLARSALLKPSELGEIVGDTDVRQEFAFDKPEQSFSGIDPKSCVGRVLFQQSIAAYGYLSTVGDQNTGARGQSVSQLIQVFPVTTKAWPASNRLALHVASTIIQKLYDEQCCEGTAVTVTVNGSTQHWKAGPVTSENLPLSMISAKTPPEAARAPCGNRASREPAITPSWPAVTRSSNRLCAAMGIRRPRPIRSSTESRPNYPPGSCPTPGIGANESACAATFLGLGDRAHH
jgi:hypothetical protein